MPGWLCGRLASVYRSLKRYDDEVMLLERYRESQHSEDARTRFDARLSKARAIAERKRRAETGALETVREVRRRSSQRRRTPRRSIQTIPESATASPADARLCAALTDVSPAGAAHTRAVLGRLCADARSRGTSLEELVDTLKHAWIDTPCPADMAEQEWHERYSSALVELLALHFGDAR